MVISSSATAASATGRIPVPRRVTTGISTKADSRKVNPQRIATDRR